MARRVAGLASLLGTALLVLSSCTSAPPGPPGTHVISEGRTLHLLRIESGAIVEVASASIPAAGLLDGHQIFNVIAHPSQPWLYTASMNECQEADFWCWGNARIDRFVVGANTLTHAGAAFMHDATQVDIPCAQAVVDPAYVGQVGYCAPVGMVFSSGADRLYVDDDDADVVHIFSVAASGNLTFLHEGAATEAHGLAIDPTDTYLYNGSNVISVAGDVATSVFVGMAGNTTTLVSLAGDPGLVTTQWTEGVAVYDLADPLAPALVDLYDFGASNQARDLAFDPALNRIVAVGRDVVHTLSFDGATFSLDDTHVPPWAEITEYRGVARVDGDMALASWFVNDAGAISGGADLFSVAANGELALLDSVDYVQEARVVFALP
ncbi:MAG: hypothetical protein R6W77_02870, partial [Trueperaceae bacterium]